MTRESLSIVFNRFTMPFTATGRRSSIAVTGTGFRKKKWRDWANNGPRTRFLCYLGGGGSRVYGSRSDLVNSSKTCQVTPLQATCLRSAGVCRKIFLGNEIKNSLALLSIKLRRIATVCFSGTDRSTADRIDRNKYAGSDCVRLQRNAPANSRGIAGTSSNGVASSSIGTQRRRLFDLIVFDGEGNFSKKSMLRTDLLKATGLYARDLINIDTGFHRRPRPVLLVRNSAVVVNFVFIRAILKFDGVYLFNPSDEKVERFAKRLSRFIKGHETQLLDEISNGPLDLNGHERDAKLFDGDCGSIGHETGLNSSEETRPVDFPFELRAFEGVLSQVCRIYEERRLLLSPLVRNVLHSLSAKQVNSEILHQLVPMKDALSQFEIESTMMRDVVNDTIHSEELMLEMLLTEKEKSGGKTPDFEKHTVVELLLENYLSKLADISQEVYYLRRRVENTQNIVQLKLDAFRNQIIFINVQLALGSVALGSGTLLSGLFGANLLNGFETHPMGFYSLCGFSAVGVVLVYKSLLALVRGSMPLPLETDATSIFNHLDDIEQVLSDLRRSEKSGGRISRQELRKMLILHSGVALSDEDLDVVFCTYDRDRDGYLTIDELGNRIQSYKQQKNHGNGIDSANAYGF